MEFSLINQNWVVCRRCLALMAASDDFCAACGNGMGDKVTGSLLAKIGHFLGIEISSEIVTINLEDSGHFFTNQEINELLDMSDVSILSLDEVSDHNSMFYPSKRVSKPSNRK